MAIARFVVFLIALSLVIQNTCPYGWAAKTVFISPHTSQCSHCPLRENKGTASDTKNDVRKDISSVNHLFVIHVGERDVPLKSLPPVSFAVSFKSDRVYSVFLEPLLRPPAFSFSA